MNGDTCVIAARIESFSNKHAILERSGRHCSSRFVLFATIVFFFWLGISIPGSQSALFTSGDGDWNVGTNWDTGVSPTLTGAEAFIRNGGTARITANASADILQLDDGTVEHTAGTFTSDGRVRLGWGNGVTSHYNLSAGATLSLAGENLTFGEYGGTAEMITSGEIFTPGDIIIGKAHNAPFTGNGDVTMNGGSIDGGVIMVGQRNFSVGVLNQNAGTVTASLWFEVASNTYDFNSANASGTYNLSGGTLRSMNGDGMLIGNTGTGVVNQSGGQVDAFLDLRIGHGDGGNGTYNQTGGITNVGRRLRIGQHYGGTGEYNLVDGTLNVTNVSPVSPEWIEVGGSESVGGSPSNGTGTFNISGGTLNNVGALRIGLQGTGVVNQTGGTVNTGTLGGNVSLANHGGSGSYNLQGGVLNVSGRNIEAGFAGSNFNFTGGTLMNVGTFGATLEQEGGTLAPGASTGTMAIDLDYLLSSGSYQVEIDASSNDLLRVGIDANLDADSNGTGTTLAVELLGGFLPSLGDSFTIMSSGNGGDGLGTISGEFAELDTGLAQLAGDLAWDIIYNPQSVVLEVVLSGDFDDNGKVDGLDFLLWQRHPSVGSLADWEANYGSTGSLAALVATVPEPASGAALICVWLFSIFCRLGGFGETRE